MNIFANMDAVELCRKIPPEIQFDLVYLDPPYATGLAFRTRDGEHAYDDKFTPESLCAMLGPRIEAIRERMSSQSSLFLHLDKRAVYDAKTLCDRIFGRAAFCGDIIWQPGNGARGNGLPSTHQTILVYAIGEFEWNSDDGATREPYADASTKTHFRNVDAAGRAYRDRTVKGKVYRYYADEGKAIGSVWTDISAMLANSPVLAESTGYPTQKPERLLERIIVGASKAGQTVADLMCGSGTALAVADRLGRKFVGADIGQTASETTKRRLSNNKTQFEIIT